MKGLGRPRHTESFTHYRHDPEDPITLSHDVVRVLYEDRQGTLGVGTGSPDNPDDRGGLNRFDPQTDSFTRYLHDPADPTTLIHNKIMSLFEDSQGTFWRSGNQNVQIRRLGSSGTHVAEN